LNWTKTRMIFGRLPTAFKRMFHTGNDDGAEKSQPAARNNPVEEKPLKKAREISPGAPGAVTKLDIDGYYLARQRADAAKTRLEDKINSGKMKKMLKEEIAELFRKLGGRLNEERRLNIEIIEKFREENYDLRKKSLEKELEKLRAVSEQAGADKAGWAREKGKLTAFIEDLKNKINYMEKMNAQESVTSVRSEKKVKEKESPAGEYKGFSKPGELTADTIEKIFNKERKAWITMIENKE